MAYAREEKRTFLTTEASIVLRLNVKITHDAKPSKPFSPEVHNISQESFSLFGKIAQEMINPDDETKNKLIKTRVSPESFSFPLKAYKDKQKKAGVRRRCCRHQWFTQFEFIFYDEKEDGLFCLTCLLFAVNGTCGGRAKTLITQVYSTVTGRMPPVS